MSCIFAVFVVIQSVFLRIVPRLSRCLRISWFLGQQLTLHTSSRHLGIQKGLSWGSGVESPLLIGLFLGAPEAHTAALSQGLDFLNK